MPRYDRYRKRAAEYQRDLNETLAGAWLTAPMTPFEAHWPTDDEEDRIVPAWNRSPSDQEPDDE